MACVCWLASQRYDLDILLKVNVLATFSEAELG